MVSSMTGLIVGQQVTLSFTLMATDGTLSDAAVLTLEVKDPNAIRTSYVFGSSAIVRDGVGLYHYDLDLLVGGARPWAYHWVASGGGPHAAAEGTLQVAEDITLIG